MDIPEHLVKRRWSIAVAAAIIATVGLVATAVSLWTNRVLFDTDSWTETVGEIGTNPPVTDVLTEQITADVVEWLDAEERLETVLPPAVRPLSGLLATQIDDFVETEVMRFFESDFYKELWLDLNRVAHSAAVAVIRDEVPLTSTSGGVVTVDLTPIVQPIVDRVFASVTELGEMIPDSLLDRVDFDDSISELIQRYETEGLPARMSSVEVFDSERLATIQSAAATLDRLVWVLPLLTIISIAVALYWAPNRFRMAGLLLGLGALGWLASLIAVEWIGNSIVSGLDTDDSATIAKALVDGISGGLEGLLVVLVVVGGLGGLAILGWTAYQSHLKRSEV